jgi:hypothetical protein
MVTRRVFTDGGELIREGLAPKDLPNRRQDLLDWWAAEDARIAEEEALTAQAEVDRLAALEQEPSNDTMAIPGLMAAVEQHATLIEELDQRTAQIEAAQPEEIVRLAAQIQLGAGAAQALEATSMAVRSEIQTVADQAQQRLDELDQKTAESIGKVADVVEFSRQQIESTAASLLADTKRQTAATLTTLTARVADLRGPRGSVGAAGVSTVIGSGQPQGADALMALINRGAIVGDCYIDGSDNDRRAYRWDGQSWESGPAMATVQVRDVKISALDASTKQFPVVSAAAGGGGGGTGGEPLLVNRAALSTGVMIADSSNWAGVSDPTAGQLVVEIVALDGTLQGRRGFACVDFTWQPSGAQDSQAGLLGDLAGVFDLNLSYQRVAATAPAGLGIAIPPATSCLQVFATVVPDPGGGGTGGVTNFRISGDLEWAHQSLGQAVPLNSSAGLKPLWRWV